jgi:uncharacterized membrane protein (DUF485 family)
VSSTEHVRGHAASAHSTYTEVEQRYVAMQQSPEFQDLRRRYRGWVLPVAAVSLVWYFAYVALAAYASGFMGRAVYGNINIGLVMGLLQFVSTFAVTALYVRHADHVLDPASSRLRRQFEDGDL